MREKVVNAIALSAIFVISSRNFTFSPPKPTNLSAFPQGDRPNSQFLGYGRLDFYGSRD